MVIRTKLFLHLELLEHRAIIVRRLLAGQLEQRQQQTHITTNPLLIVQESELPAQKEPSGIQRRTATLPSLPSPPLSTPRVAVSSAATESTGQKPLQSAQQFEDLSQQPTQKPRPPPTPSSSAPAQLLCDLCGDEPVALVCSNEACPRRHLCLGCDQRWHGHPSRRGHEREGADTVELRRKIPSSMTASAIATLPRPRTALEPAASGIKPRLVVASGGKNSVSYVSQLGLAASNFDSEQQQQSKGKDQSSDVQSDDLKIPNEREEQQTDAAATKKQETESSESQEREEKQRGQEEQERQERKEQQRKQEDLEKERDQQRRQEEQERQEQEEQQRKQEDLAKQEREQQRRREEQQKQEREELSRQAERGRKEQEKRIAQESDSPMDQDFEPSQPDHTNQQSTVLQQMLQFEAMDIAGNMYSSGGGSLGKPDWDSNGFATMPTRKAAPKFVDDSNQDDCSNEIYRPPTQQAHQSLTQTLESNSHGRSHNLERHREGLSQISRVEASLDLRQEELLTYMQMLEVRPHSDQAPAVPTSAGFPSPSPPPTPPPQHPLPEAPILEAETTEARIASEEDSDQGSDLKIIENSNRAVCPVCSMSSELDTYNQVERTDAGTSQSATASSSSWECQVCTFVNSDTDCCQICENRQSSSSSSAAVPSAPLEQSESEASAIADRNARLLDTIRRADSGDGDNQIADSRVIIAALAAAGDRDIPDAQLIDWVRQEWPRRVDRVRLEATRRYLANRPDLKPHALEELAFSQHEVSEAMADCPHLSEADCLPVVLDQCSRRRERAVQELAQLYPNLSCRDHHAAVARADGSLEKALDQLNGLVLDSYLGDLSLAGDGPDADAAACDMHVTHLNCPVCRYPKANDVEALQLHFQHMLAQIAHFQHPALRFEPDDVNRLQDRLFDWQTMRNPDFVWCSHCGTGFELDAEAGQNRFTCPRCRRDTCRECRKPWEKQHKGLSCEDFERWKQENDPEFQTRGVAFYLQQHGIECPACHFKYALAGGGCLHFVCRMCRANFCSGCGNLFQHTDSQGLACRHPRSCLYHLRDFDIDRLQQLLRMHKVEFRSFVPDDEEFDECKVMEQKETADGLVDEACSRRVHPGRANLCDKHYSEYLVTLINRNRLDPVEIMTPDELVAVCRRHGLQVALGSKEVNVAELKKAILAQCPL
uniref:IBR domain-containing protein n=1 Tax=Macrostomum lignano TaxID=282301 RepID=A0A1I8H8R9_9PLAT